MWAGEPREGRCTRWDVLKCCASPVKELPVFSLQRAFRGDVLRDAGVGGELGRLGLWMGERVRKFRNSDVVLHKSRVRAPTRSLSRKAALDSGGQRFATCAHFTV